MNDDGEVEALRLLVSSRLPWITQQHFAGMLDVLIRGERWIVNRRRSYAFSHHGRTDQVDVYFLFEWQRFCL